MQEQPTPYIKNRAESFLSTLSPDVRRDVEGKIEELSWHQRLGLLSPEMYVGKTVLDWEAGLCGFSAAFYCLGAANVVAIDSWVQDVSLPAEYLALKEFSFSQISIAEFVSMNSGSGIKFDLLFSNTVTEHISDLPAALSNLKSILRPDGFYLNVHDNYYSPCGSHDHGFWFYGSDGAIDFQGRNCWASPSKCEASAEHRDKLLKQMPWTWNSELEQKRDPEHCENCAYFRRSQPWAHLVNVNEFVEAFNDPSFLTWRPGSSLNKVTTFQMRQLLVEAGFRVLGFHRNSCTNEPPDALLDAGFSRLELTTTTSVWLSANA